MKMLQEKIRAISGIQPSNKITLGNYLGAIKQLVELQDKYELFIFIADLHSISNVIIEPSQLKINRDTLLKTYAALGLDFSKTHIFFQSDIPAHCELN
jgi:tryptophanyl-tRNA synthetase